MSHAEGRGTYTQEEEDSLFTKYTVYSIPTPEGKPVRVVYEGREKPTHTDTQPCSDTHTYTQQENTHTDSMIDTHTHIQQEDATHVYSTEDTHYYT